MNSLRLFVLTALSAFNVSFAIAEEIKLFHPLAIFPFEERGLSIKGMGAKVADLVFAKMANESDMYLVDRAELDKLLQEQKLNLSGLVRPDQAIAAGQLTGAKILVTGSVVEADEDLVLVAKIIGTETSRVKGASVTASLNDPLPPIADQLATEIVAVLRQQAAELVAAPRSEENRLEVLRKKLGDAKRPILSIAIAERHVGKATIDPAAETEMINLSRESGFEVLDASRVGKERSDILISGEGFSELAGSQGELLTVKGRVEIKAVQRTTGRVLATERQTVLVVDLAEHSAGKAALQQASAIIAERLLPKLVTTE